MAGRECDSSMTKTDSPLLLGDSMKKTKKSILRLDTRFCKKKQDIFLIDLSLTMSLNCISGLFKLNMKR